MKPKEGICFLPKMPNILKFDSEARQKLLDGLNTVADAVGATLGPKGRNVAIEQGPLTPHVVHDGVTVARSITLKDPFENMGAQLIKSSAQKTNDKAGDGTTTATVLAQAIANEGLKRIAAGENPMTLKKEIEDSLQVVLTKLGKLAKQVETDEELEQIATISSSDPELGTLIAQAVKKVGKDGVVTVEEGSGFETSVDYKQGMEIERGYLSPYFITDPARSECVYNDAYLLITDQKISHNFELMPFLEKFFKDGKKPLVIMASTVDDEALATLVVNRLKGGFEVCAIQAPSWGPRRLDELEDIAVLTGGVVITQDSGRALESVQLEELGRADKIVISRDNTVITGGKGAKKAIERRVDDLKSQIELATTDYDKDIKKQRMAKLVGGVAVINVGGTTEVELKERKERVIDAVNATKAAIEDGIVAGGELTLLRLSVKCKGVLGTAMREPFKKLMENAGFEYGDVAASMFGQPYPFGIDVTDGEVKDLILAGIIDPVKVTRSALENAVSIATMIMTTNVLIVEDREDK